MKNFFKTLYKARKSLYSLLVLAVMQSYMLVPSLYSVGSSLSEVFSAGALTLPSNSTLYQWRTSPLSWHTGALQSNNSDYKEGESVPFRLDVSSATSGVQYQFSICRGYQNGSVRGYYEITAYNASRSLSAAQVGGVVTSVNGPISGVNVNIDSVVEVGGQGVCSAGDRETVVQITRTGNSPYVLWGGKLASPVDVGAGNGASQYPGGSLHMKLLSPSKDLSINPSGIIELASITVQKVVLSGTSTPDDWCFTISPDPYGESPKCIPNGLDTVTFLGLETVSGGYQINEVTQPGYSFVSGSGTSCAFNGSTATATVVSSEVATNATCIFSNGVNPSGLTVYKDVVDPDGNPIVDTSELFTVTLNGADPKTFIDGESVPYPNISAGTYTVNEINLPTGYSAFRAEDMEGNVLDVDLSDGVQVTVGEAQTKEIKIVNKQQKGTVTVYKDVVSPNGFPVNDATIFTVDLTGTEVVNNEEISEGNPAELSLNPGVYTINEDSNPNYSQTNDSQCNNNEFTVTPGGSTEITCINAQKNATVNVYKDVKDYDGSNIVDSTEFTVNLNGVNGTDYSESGSIQDTFLDLNLQTPETFTVAPGQYQLSEDDAFGFEEMGCKVTMTGSLEDNLDLNLSSNQSVDVYCVNQVEVGDIVVTKVLTTPDGLYEVTNDNTNFTIVLDGDMGTAQVVKGGNSVTFENVRVGNHTIAEIAPSNYNFVGFSIDVNVDTSDGAQIVVTKNSATNLTITNSQDWARIYVDKNVGSRLV